ncbi:ABC transporter ATP-binding protein [Gryllotalpicola protaetiae]|uniref:ABC transporter ATP-binding protein n=1 Tax=Gryllotalpicola protaetiae TaxID=2419771 RepID=A0A387BRT7_9MICO|nr:ABC transporter ATP-binding protein [Gryllotalpicola protaetiae]AYG03657.1 ABC transporter ATP-binding protein [Gryllotalpicola protaetiae]
MNSEGAAPVIEIRGLAKHFGKVHALDGLDLTVTQGEVHGYLGPNGAGKSTTIRILLGLARATGGEARVFGADPWREASALHRRISTIPGDVALWPNLSGGETIDLLVKLRGGDTKSEAYTAARAQLIEEFQFDPSKKARSYSKGNRQKVALIAALSHPADLYIFDEPTSGLDPLMEAVFTKQVGAAAERGGTVLLSSHILSEVEKLCTRISIVRAGKVVESGTMTELRHLTRTSFSFERNGLTDAQLAGIPGAHDIGLNEGRVSFTVDSDQVAAALPALGALGVAGLQVAPPSLEELFLRHYGDVVAPAEA